MIIIDHNKLERQKVVVQNWVAKTKAKGGAVLPTGFGKTWVGGIAMDRLFYRHGIDYTDVIVVVPSVAIIENWQKVIKDKPYEHKVHILTRNQILEDNRLFTCKLLIVDEVHEFYADESWRIISGELIQFEFIFWLTATLEDPKKRHTKLLEKYPCADELSEEECIANEWISNFVEYNYGVELDDNDKVHEIEDENNIKHMLTRKEYYKHLSGRVSHFNAKFGNNGLDLAKYVLNGNAGIDKDGKPFEYDGMAYAVMWARKMGWRTDLDDTIPEEKAINDEWHPKMIIGYARNLFNFTKKRKSLLYEAYEKIDPAIQIINDPRFNTLKFISFSQSTLFADKLCDGINSSNKSEICTLYHSKIESRPLINPNTGDFYRYDKGKKKGQPIIYGKTRLKKFAIEAIRGGFVRGVSTASALDKGFDVVDLGLVVTASGTSNFNQHKQRTGRGKRFYLRDSITLIINIYLKDTKDYDWLINRQKKSNNKVYWVSSLEQIDFTPKVRNTLKLDLDV